jgi:porin
MSGTGVAPKPDLSTRNFARPAACEGSALFAAATLTSRDPMSSDRLLWLLLPTLCALAFCGLARAEDAVLTTPTPQNEAAPPGEQPSISSSLPKLGEFKKALIERGFNLQVNYFGETLGNPTGGVKQGAIYEGLLEMSIDGDLKKIAGLPGATFHVNAYQIHGRGLTTYNIFNYSTISGIEARRTTRLFELWFEQKFFGGLAALRVGQLAADTEFILSDFDALYFNGTYGWPNITSVNLPGTGPHFPVTTPGLRLKLTPNDQTELLFGVFNGDPAGVGLDTALTEIKDPSGINFRLKDPPLAIGEAQFKYTLPIGSDGLAGKARIGGWRHFGKFDDRYLGIDGLSLVNPSSNGTPVTHAGDFGIYGIIDQMILRLPGDDPKRGIGVYGFAMVCPPNRNLMEFDAQAGISFGGLLDSRPDDIFGLAAAFSKLSSSVQKLDRDARLYSDASPPVRNYELALELTYQAQIIPGVIVQPDFQYIFFPGAGAANPLYPSSGKIPNAAVFGLRFGVKY